LLSLTRLGEMVLEPVDVREVLAQSLVLIGAQAQQQALNWLPLIQTSVFRSWPTSGNSNRSSSTCC
jgi:hypothetical protein